MERAYMPEGIILKSEENRFFTESLEGLEKALETGRILEAKAVLCDSDKNIHVELAGFRGIIPKDEAVYMPAGGQVKDIAVITRVGKSVCFKVTAIQRDADGTKIMLSRRLAQKECCENYIKKLENGDVIEALVTHMEKFGAFCDIGCGYAALLPIDCISVSRINHPSERFECGRKIRCVVKNIDRENLRVTLTRKELLGTWEENAAFFSPGETACGIVRSIEPYGIFVELTPNIAGLAEWCDGISAGSGASVYIKSIIPEKMKIKLVIIDTSDAAPFDLPEDYFFKDSHMGVWRYSPEGCSKTVITEF